MNSLYVCRAIKFASKTFSSFYRIYSFLLESGKSSVYFQVRLLANIKCYNFCLLKSFSVAKLVGLLLTDSAKKVPTYPFRMFMNMERGNWRILTRSLCDLLKVTLTVPLRFHEL